MNKKAVILINVGTPDSPDVKSVRKYLKEFLSDGRVIDIPTILRKILVNLIIVPFRARKSAGLYKLLWNDKGSPLLYYSESLRDKLRLKIEGYEIHIAMRYGNPSLKTMINKLKSGNYSEIIFVPLYPQYASSTTGSVLELIYRELGTSNIIPFFKTVGQFYHHPDFISAFVRNIQKFVLSQYNHVVFSFHGLPLSHIEKSHPSIKPEACNCMNEMPEHGNYCYKATCFETARLIAEECNIPKEKFSVSFQSRLTKNWLSPFTDNLLIEKAKAGVKNILVVSPSFVTDCLETLVELEIEYSKLFKENGGEKLSLVPSLNDSDHWSDGLNNIIFETFL